MTSFKMKLLKEHIRYDNFTINDIDKIAYREFGKKTDPINSLLIVPNNSIHDSGYMQMDFMAIDEEGFIKYKFGGCSDVLFLETMIYANRNNWSIDCTRHGIVRLYANRPIIIGDDLSTLEIKIMDKEQ